MLKNDEIKLAGMRTANQLGLTRREDQEVAAKAFGAVLALSQFLGDFKLQPMYIELSKGVYERLSKKGKQQYEAAVSELLEIETAS